MDKQRTVQEVFNVVIAKDIYPINEHYMCVALEQAVTDHFITVAECSSAKLEITNYLAELSQGEPFRPSSLYTAFERLGLERAPRDLLTIYQDWANRPRLAS